MKSVFERALGQAYTDLHPAICERYTLTSADDRRCVGRGRMRSIRRNPLALPVLWAGTAWNLLFPEAGTNVSFEVRTFPFDDDGVETLAYIRRFDTDPGRRFDAYMHYDEARDTIIDALGSHRNLISELTVSAGSSGALYIENEDQWASYNGRTIPIPKPLQADVAVTEEYDDDNDRFEIEVTVSNPLVGRVFAYDGWFTVEYESCPRLRHEDAPTDWNGA